MAKTDIYILSAAISVYHIQKHCGSMGEAGKAATLYLTSKIVFSSQRRRELKKKKNHRICYHDVKHYLNEPAF